MAQLRRGCVQLSKKEVNMGELRRLACLGVPDGGAGVRPFVWKVPTRNLFPFSSDFAVSVAVLCVLLIELGVFHVSVIDQGYSVHIWSALFASLE